MSRRLGKERRLEKKQALNQSLGKWKEWFKPTVIIRSLSYNLSSEADHPESIPREGNREGGCFSWLDICRVGCPANPGPGVG